MTGHSALAVRCPLFTFSSGQRMQCGIKGRLNLVASNDASIHPSILLRSHMRMHAGVDQLMARLSRLVWRRTWDCESTVLISTPHPVQYSCTVLHVVLYYVVRDV